MLTQHPYLIYVIEAHRALLLASREGRPRECVGSLSSTCSRAEATHVCPLPGGPAMSKQGLAWLSPFIVPAHLRCEQVYAEARLPDSDMLSAWPLGCSLDGLP